ncbi:ethanolamine utilization protein EutH [Gracilibacillus halophilus YIM-C55.5]|uniref:Ethanolamine utilization protein EutH n=1 Tax=Gracilibacillus halophilus YIM-C55.5 TaxID=1308866 RepID=N4WQP7_9BACI|nr:ethanolamine utilization protein EutH [Gracilibacillus halophilus]ENH96780.1 ethanolamine utilization protein EutH [Gracilibacillus halophilus YIM-C55.5]
MGINDIIVFIVIGFFCLGALDKCIGNKWGLGKHFDDGFMTMGSITLAIVGIISLAPVLASILTPLISPIYGLVGADPASFANTILALDTGGYALATEMSQNADAELFAWVFLGTMMGPTIVLTIPVGVGMIDKKDHPFFAKGILLGIITVPIGSLIGGIIANIPLLVIIKNLIPPIVLSIVISVGLWKYTNKMILGFSVFAKGINIMATIGLTAISIETFTGVTVIPNMTPLMEGMEVVTMIAVFLAGAFPFVAFISFVCKKPLKTFGRLLGINERSTAGLMASLAHNIPMFSIFKEMDDRGKVINVAFAVSGAFVFGAHLGFVAGVNKDVVFAMIIGKLFGGISAILLAIMTTRQKSKVNESDIDPHEQSSMHGKESAASH